jgi:hypothetical protein
MAMIGKRLTALEMPEEDEVQRPVAPPLLVPVATPMAASVAPEPAYQAPQSIPLPPIPPAPKREIMVQLSVKAPHALVQRLERMNSATGAQKQAILASALDAYLRGHGY